MRRLLLLLGLAVAHELDFDPARGFHEHQHFSGPHTGQVEAGPVPELWGTRQQLPNLSQGTIPEPQSAPGYNGFPPIREGDIAWPLLDYSPNLNIPGRSMPFQQPAFTDGNGRWNDGHFGGSQGKRFLDPVDAYKAAGNIRRLNGERAHYHDKWGRSIRAREQRGWYPWLGTYDEELIPEEDRRGFRDFYDPKVYPQRRQNPGPTVHFDSRRASLGDALGAGQRVPLAAQPSFDDFSGFPEPPSIPPRTSEFAVVEIPAGPSNIPGIENLPDPSFKAAVQRFRNLRFTD